MIYGCWADDQLKKAGKGDGCRVITGKRDMAGWYIAPYYDSREQYLYGYYEDFSVREHLYNFGEVIDVAVEKRIKKQRAVYSCCITTTDRAFYLHRVIRPA